MGYCPTCGREWKPGSLTTRQLEVLRRVTLGEENTEIAAALGLADNTIRNHLKVVMAKLGAKNRTQAAMIAIKQGLIEA